jgi:hypothetical protein
MAVFNPFEKFATLRAHACATSSRPARPHLLEDAVKEERRHDCRRCTRGRVRYVEPSSASSSPLKTRSEKNVGTNAYAAG